MRSQAGAHARFETNFQRVGGCDAMKVLLGRAIAVYDESVFEPTGSLATGWSLR